MVEELGHKGKHIARERSKGEGSGLIKDTAARLKGDQYVTCVGGME